MEGFSMGFLQGFLHGILQAQCRRGLQVLFSIRGSSRPWGPLGFLAEGS